MDLPPGLAAALVLSNTAIIPAIVYAGYRRIYVEMAIAIGVLAASTAFHICQVGWFCFGLTLHSLQLTDHFMVYFALFWFSLYFVGASERTRAAIVIALSAVTLPVIATFMGTWLPGVIVIGMTIALAAIVLAVDLYLYGGPYISWKPLGIAFVLLATGVVLHVYGGDFGPENWKYPLAHSIWHILAMGALLFVLAIPFRDHHLIDQPAHVTEQGVGRLGSPYPHRSRKGSKRTSLLPDSYESRQIRKQQQQQKQRQKKRKSRREEREVAMPLSLRG